MVSNLDAYKEAMKQAFDQGALGRQTFGQWWDYIEEKANTGQMLSLSREAPVFKIQNIVALADINEADAMIAERGK